MAYNYSLTIPNEIIDKWNNQHVAQIKKEQMIYRKNNKQRIKLHNDKHNKLGKTKIICGCGCVISKKNMSCHKKTKKHFNKLMEIFLKNE